MIYRDGVAEITVDSINETVTVDGTVTVDSITDPVTVNIADPRTDEAVHVENNALSTITHSHPDQGVAHFHITGLTAATYNYILIDLSDTTNYPHANTSVIHIDWLKFEIDANTNGQYIISWGVLENVDATNGDFSVIDHISGSKSTGNTIKDFYPFGSAGWLLDTSKFVTGHKSLNDAVFQTDVNLPSTTSPGSPNTPSGDGDLVMRVELAAGEIDVICTVGYHTHSPTHN